MNVREQVGSRPTGGATTAALEAIDVRTSLPLGRERIEILKGVSLRIGCGEIVALVGPSGSGKSTLLGIIAGLDRPTSGRVLVNGTDITAMDEGRLAAVRNRDIGMVFQAFNLLPTLTAQENVEAPLYVGRRPGRPADRAKELLALVGVGHRLKNRPHQLSGGEQQRVAIARALATAPAIVIMDEPTGNLDTANGETVMAVLEGLNRDRGVAVVLVTHDRDVAARAHRQVHMRDGVIEVSVPAGISA